MPGLQKHRAVCEYRKFQTYLDMPRIIQICFALCIFALGSVFGVVMFGFALVCEIRWPK